MHMGMGIGMGVGLGVDLGVGMGDLELQIPELLQGVMGKWPP